MAKFYNKGPAIFQSPVEKTAADGSRSASMGFCIAICDNGCGDEESDAHNAEIIVKALNRDDDVKELINMIASFPLEASPSAFPAGRKIYGYNDWEITTNHVLLARKLLK